MRQLIKKIIGYFPEFCHIRNLSCVFSTYISSCRTKPHTFLRTPVDISESRLNLGVGRLGQKGWDAQLCKIMPKCFQMVVPICLAPILFFLFAVIPHSLQILYCQMS